MKENYQYLHVDINDWESLNDLVSQIYDRMEALESMHATGLSDFTVKVGADSLQDRLDEKDKIIEDLNYANTKLVKENAEFWEQIGQLETECGTKENIIQRMEEAENMRRNLAP